MADLSPDQIRELDTLTAPRPIYDMNGLVGLDTGLGLNMPGPTTPAPYQPIPAGAGYQSQIDPMYLSQGEADTGDSGLGLSSEPGSPQTPGWAHALYGIGGALEAFSAGFHGREPLILKYAEQQQLQQAKLQQQAALRKEAIAQQQAQLAEQKRQHEMGLLEKAMKDPRQLEALSNTQGFGMQSQAKMLFKTMKDADYQAWPRYQKTLESISPGITKRFTDGDVDYYELNSLMDVARESEKVNWKEQAKTAALNQALATPEAERTPFQKSLINDKELAQKKVQSEIDENTAHAAKDRREADMGPPDHSVLNRVHQQITGGKSYELGTPETQAKALQQYAEMNAQGRTNVQMNTPAPVQQRSNVINRSEFLKTGSLVMPPAGASEGQIRSGDYIEITDKQKDAWGEVVNSGNTLGVLFDMVEPLITAKTPVQAGKQWARLHYEAATKKNPAAATYLTDSEAFSSRMARVFGSEVGVLTQPDVVRWQRALPTFGDTQDVLTQKKKVFMEIYKQSRSMAIKKIAGEDISKDQERLRRGALAEADKLNPPSIDDDLSTLFGGAK